MTETTKLFLDTKFTGLHQGTTLVSIGIVDEDYCGSFYAELTDYDSSQVDAGVLENVIKKLVHGGVPYMWRRQDTLRFGIERNVVSMCGDRHAVRQELKKWLEQYDTSQIWSDCLAYDWVLFNELWGGAMRVPGYVSYIPMDICTMFQLAGIDPDVNREEFAGIADGGSKHNALHDAKVIRECYVKLASRVGPEFGP